MALVLGIDTGGTFTDSVVVDVENHEILCKAKAPTSYKDLSEGINNSLNKLPESMLKDISFVSLSTTLATNAIVENRRCRTGLILMGMTLDEQLPSDVIVNLEAKINIKGQIVKDLDEGQMKKAVDLLKGKIDVVAVSGLSSVRNPIHENRIKKYMMENLDVPVICAHELTGQLGYYERTVTCALNAGLLPIIRELIDSTKKSLEEKNINKPMMVVKGDGALMHETVAIERPVETLLSGPAASVNGASFLTGMKYGMILDMGGTTTDIADFANGKTNIDNEGAVVSGWSTKVRAINICTYGLGGDSYVYYDNNGKIVVGPRKVMPICVLADEYPHITEEMTKFRKPAGYELCREKSTDCFIYVKEETKHEGLSHKVLDILKEKPHSLYWLADYFNKDADKLGLSKLVDEGCVDRASMTPTDLLVAEGHLNMYNRDGAKIAVKIMADIGGVGDVDFIISAKRFIYRRIAGLCIQSACHFEGHDFDIALEDAAKYFLSIAFRGRKEGILHSEFTLSKPIIAIGAPVKAWLYNTGQYLNTTIVIPEHAEVANAIGAAVARIREEKHATIRFDAVTDKYILYTEDGRDICSNLDDAKKMAVEKVSELARKAAEADGCRDCKITVSQDDKYTEIFTSGTKHYTETLVDAVAVGKPKWSEQ